jgi:hypothetical protein
MSEEPIVFCLFCDHEVEEKVCPNCGATLVEEAEGLGLDYIDTGPKKPTGRSELQKAKRRIATLERRLNFLQGREEPNNYVKAEISALVWALPILHTYRELLEEEKEAEGRKQSHES